MPCILTVDDSRAIRMIVSRVVQDMGFDVAEAEDGVLGLARLEQAEFALVILDVTMPNLDGPGMLAQMREKGDMTPVLMLTSESKRSIIADVMKNKIEDYILKPFKSDELKTKILKILRQRDPGLQVSLGLSEPARSVTVAKQQVAVTETCPRPTDNILVIDDMENVFKKLRTLIPVNFSMATALNGQVGLALCREKTFRLILIDRDLPDVQGTVLLKQIRVLQPGTACFAMALKSSNNLAQEVKDEGFDDLLVKPFSVEAVDKMLVRFFDSNNLVTREENLLVVSAFVGKEGSLDLYFQRVKELLKESVHEIAEACFETLIIDASKMPVDSKRNVSVVQELAEVTKKFGLSVCLVGSPEIKKSLMLFDTTAAVQVFSTIDEARARSEA